MILLIEYADIMEGFQEIPNEISLLINLANCQNNCKGCHSPWLKNGGQCLTYDVLDDKLSEGPYTCVCFMGEGNNFRALFEMMKAVRVRNKKVAVYCGRNVQPLDWITSYCFIPDYLKIGAYEEQYGPLNRPTTNQRLFRLSPFTATIEDITPLFWKHLT